MKVWFKKKTLGSKPKNFDNSPTARGEKMASQCIMSCFPKVKKIKTKEKPKVFVYLKDMPIAMQIDFIIEGSYTYLPLDRATQTRSSVLHGRSPHQLQHMDLHHQFQKSV